MFSTIFLRIKTTLKGLIPKWNTFYKDKIWTNTKYISALENRFKHYLPKREPHNSVWVDLRLMHGTFFTTIHYPRSILAFILLLPIVSVLSLIQLSFLVIFGIYWVYKFSLFLYLPLRPQIKLIKPSRWFISYRGGFVLTSLYLYCFYRPYLRSYSYIYIILNKVYATTKPNNKSFINLSLIFIGGFLLVIRYLIGLPLRVVYDSFMWSFKFRYFWGKNGPRYESNQKLSEVREIFSYISIDIYGSIVGIERCVVYKSSKLGYRLYFNPKFDISNIKAVPLKKTSIPCITHKYMHEFKRNVATNSFRAIEKDECFPKWHSAGTLDLGNNTYMVNFLSSKPKYNLVTPIRYTYHGRVSYEVGGLILPQKDFILSPPNIPNPYKDFRVVYYTHHLHVESVVNHVLFNSKVGLYDPLSKYCTKPLITLDDLDHNLLWLNQFRYDLESDPINALFFENLTSEGVLDLRASTRSLVLLDGWESSNNFSTQINNSIDSLKDNTWTDIDV